MAHSNVTDTPLRPSEDDQLGQAAYAEALSVFLSNAQTPTTIAIQGEWGSGKTSLMNAVAGDICINYSSLYDGITDETESLNKDAPYIGVWINTWQYSLLKDDKNALISVIEGVTGELSAQMDQFLAMSVKVREVGKKLMSSMSGFALSAAKMGLSTIGINSTGLDDLAEIVQSKQLKGPIQFRRQLQETVNNYLEEIKKAKTFKNARGFIFFIDDLDRLDPPVAVQVLSLLKNLFEVNHCIFVLAIDYDVVVKGLKKQFGEKTDANEREFRSFFDKIIQLTFRMPLDNYKTNSYLKENLRKINFCPDDKLDNTDFISKLDQLTVLTCGKNPRSIKRMLNTLSLIHQVHEISRRYEGLSGKNNILNEFIYLELLLAVVSIQVSYPMLYEQIVRRPNLYQWTFAKDDGDDIPDDSTENAIGIDDRRYLLDASSFDIERVISDDPWMRKRKVVISTLLAFIVNLIYEHQSTHPDTADFGSTEQYLRKVLEISHVTSTSDDRPITIKEIKSKNDFLDSLGSYGVESGTIELAKEFLTRLDSMLPAEQIETEFDNENIYYLTKNIKTGRTVRLYEITVNKDHMTCKSERTENAPTTRIHIGSPAAEGNNPGYKKTIYETVDDIPAEQIEALRLRFIDLSGNAELPDWPVLSKEQQIYKKFWLRFKKQADADESLSMLATGRDNKWGDYYPKINLPEQWMRLVINLGWKQIAVQLYTRNKDIYRTYVANKDALEAKLGAQVSLSGENKKETSLRVVSSIDITDEANWNDAIRWGGTVAKTIREFMENMIASQ